MNDSHQKLIESLQDPQIYPHEVDRVDLIETHISWILLSGAFVYKIKKPVELGFLDFSSLKKRHYYCQEELRLNQRLAPELYLDLVPIRGSVDDPCLSGEGEIIEYAVKMKRFSQESQLDRLFKKGKLAPKFLMQLAQTLAVFHKKALLALPETPFGKAENVYQPVLDCFEQIQDLGILDLKTQEQLDLLKQWLEKKYLNLLPVFQERKKQGMVRECHGDAHLGNMAFFEGRVILFDCLEFNESFRWIDVMSELAFTLMDLESLGASSYATQLLNQYIEKTSDYEGLEVLDFYKIYRALVRAKVAGIRQVQEKKVGLENKQEIAQFHDYIFLAQSYTQKQKPVIILMHGLSGCGKTYLSNQILEPLGAVRIRADIERKKMFGLQAQEQSGSELKKKMYSQETTQRVYEKLAHLSKEIVQAGYSSIIDATFLRKGQRDLFNQLAKNLGVSCIILALKSPISILEDRILKRSLQQADASEADIHILHQQIAEQDLLSPEEGNHVFEIETNKAYSIDKLLNKLLAIERHVTWHLKG